MFEYLELTFTTSVFEPETGAGNHYQYINKDDIYENLSLLKGNVINNKIINYQVIESCHVKIYFYR